MSDDTLPTTPNGPPHAAGNVVRAWQRRGVGSHPGDPPAEELPTIGEHLATVGFEVRTLEYDPDADQVTIEYRRPEGMSPKRGVEVVASLFIAVADRATGRSWNYTTVAARDGDVAWTIGQEHDLVGAATGEPTTLVSSVLNHSLQDLEGPDA